MSNKVVIKKEHLPQRCEICHQTDLFVAITGYCGKCRDSIIPMESIHNIDKITNNKSLLQKAILLLVRLLGILVLTDVDKAEKNSLLFQQAVLRIVGRLAGAFIFLALIYFFLWFSGAFVFDQ